MSRPVPNISEAEWEVLNVLWDQAPLTANEVIRILQSRTDWKPKTTRTLLDRLVKKKVVGVDQGQRVYTFSPLFSRSECQQAEAQSFLKRIYSGTLKSMLVQFVEERKLSDEEIRELRSILRDNENRNQSQT